MLHIYFFYFLLTLCVGIVSSGIALTFYVKTKDHFIRTYLYFYEAFTLMVGVNAFLEYIHINLPAGHPLFLDSLAYLDALSFFGVMVTFPIFMHQLVSAPQATRRNIMIGGITLLTYIGLQFFAYLIRENYAQYEWLGILLKNSIFLAIILYSLVIGLTCFKNIQEPARKRLTRNFLLLWGLFLPGIFNDTVLSELSDIRFYPLFYCLLSLLFTRYFIRQYHVSPVRTAEPMPDAIPSEPVPAHAPPAGMTESPPDPADASPLPETDFFARYDISPREQEIITGILQGYSYQKIGETLFISLNTVKTHIRNIYPKLGIRSRYELMTLLKDRPQDVKNTSENTG